MDRPRMTPQQSLPFLESLVGYANSGVVPFHTPGHKQGRGAYAPLQKAMTDALRLDVSDVVASKQFEDSWFAAWRAAEDLAAEAFGAERTHFVANGTSGAIHAMFLSVRMLGFTHVVLPRESHLSVFAGLVLSGLEPLYVSSAALPGWHLLLPPDASRYDGVGPDGECVMFATHPSYYGIALQLEPLVQAANASEGLLIVDEAHGPHYGFHPQLPKSALACGAHLVAQSTHKILGALTQASMLHVGTSSIPDSVVERALQLTQSTSPSGLLLASLDAARAQMALEGDVLWGRTLELGDELRAYIEDELGMSVLSKSDMPAGYQLDTSRLVIRTSDRGIHGVEAARRLRHHGIQVEMADPWHVVALLTWGDSPETMASFRQGLREAVAEKGKTALVSAEQAWKMPTPIRRMSPRKAALAPTQSVPLREARGRISAEAICPYPPGIPAVCPGEEIDEATRSYLEQMRYTSFEVRGATDPSLQRLVVVRE